MPNNSNIAKSKLKGAFTLIGTVIVVVLLLVYFLPRETKFGYEYEQGRPWRYNSLIATFDFPVYKTPDEVKAERDSALSQFQPFYTEDVQIAQRQITAFETAWRAGRFGGTGRVYRTAANAGRGACSQGAGESDAHIG